MNSRRSVVPWLFLWLLAIPILIGDVGAQEMSLQEPPPPATIHADELERFEDQHRVVGRGNVEILYKGTRVLADYMEIDTESGDGIAEGHVVIEDAENRIEAEKADFNIHSQLGVLYKASGYVGSRYYVSGEKIERLGPNRFRVQSGTLTSCEVTCPAASPPWHFRSSSALIEVGENAYLTAPSFWIKDVPVLASPYLVWPIKSERATGFLLPIPGVGSKDGIIYKHGFFWAINPSSDATFTWDYFSKRGLGKGLEYRIVPNREGYGQLNTYHINDRLTDRTFWKFNVDQHQNFQSGLKEQFKVDLLSSEVVNQDFLGNLFDRSRRTAESFFSLRQNWGTRSLELRASRLKAVDPDRTDIFGRYPQIVFNNSSERLGGGPFYFSARSSWDSLYRNLQGEKRNLGRLDLHPRLSVPLTQVPWLTITPSVGFEETYYTEGKDRNGGLSRETIDFSTQLVGPKFSRVFPWGGDRVDRLKHVIEPSISHTFIPAMDSRDRKDIISIDDIDSVGPANKITYGVTNRLLARVREKSAGTAGEEKKGNEVPPLEGASGATSTEAVRTQEVARLSITQSYTFIDSGKVTSPDQQRQRSLSDVVADGIFRPLDWGEVGVIAAYSTYDRKIDRYLLRSLLNLAPGWSASLEKQWNRQGFEGREQQDYWFAEIKGTFLDHWRATYSNRYNGVLGHSLEKIYQVEYVADCWSLAVRLNQRLTATQGKDQRILFFFSLKDVLSVEQSTPIGFSVGSSR